MWYADSKPNDIESGLQANINADHFPVTLFGGPEMQFQIEVVVRNAPGNEGLLIHDLQKVVPDLPVEIMPGNDLDIVDGIRVFIEPKTMQDAEAIVQFFRNNTYWQVEYVNMDWVWEYE
jgi:hypothetical protein